MTEIKDNDEVNSLEVKDVMIKDIIENNEGLLELELVMWGERYF